MVRTLALRTQISAGREIHIRVPEGVPVGPAEIVVIIIPSEGIAEASGTANDMLQSSLFGMWSQRDDIDDSLEFARRLRALAEQRTHG